MRVISTLNNCSLVISDGDFYYVNHELTLTDTEYQTIQQSFSLPPRTPGKANVPLSILQMQHIVELRKKITETNEMQAINNQVEKLYVITKESLPTQTEAKNLDQVVFDNKIQPLKDILGQTFTNEHGKWIITDIKGIGKSTAAFEAWLTKPSISGRLSNKKSILKLQKLNRFELFKRQMNEKTEFQNVVPEEKQNTAIKYLIKQTEDEQAKINRIAGLSTHTLANGGILEEFVSGKPLSQWLEINHTTQIKKLEVLTKIVLEVQKLHKLGLAHNDLNPDNIFIADQNNTIKVKLIDFGNSEQKGQPQRIGTMIETNDSKMHIKQKANRYEFSSPKPKKSKRKEKTKHNIKQNFFQNDYLMLNHLARAEFGITHEIITNNPEQSFKTLITGYARAYAGTSFEQSYTDNEFWQQFQKEAKQTKDPNMREILRMKKLANKLTKPFSKKLTEGITIASAVLTTAVCGTEIILNHLHSKFAIDKLITPHIFAFALVAALIGTSITRIGFIKTKPNMARFERQSPEYFTHIPKNILDPISDASPAKPTKLNFSHIKVDI